MNLILYNPPEVWTEDLILEISDEDDRYEFKSGEPWLHSDLEKKLAKEICALANSFGGTLFLGIKDESKEIVGVPKRGKGRASAKAWIENIIPNLLEFRLPNFRVLEVKLNSATKSDITNEKTVISIDVYDSDLAPHRSTKDQIYYYRQSSQSVPAPHHYLAFLWGRTSPNMSGVINAWFKLYVNDLIELLLKTKNEFSENNFQTITSKNNKILTIPEIQFFRWQSWKDLNSSLTAKQFLRTFPNIDLKINRLNTLILDFAGNVSEIEKIINDSPEFESCIRENLNRLMANRHYQNLSWRDKPFDEVLVLYAGEAFGSLISEVSRDPESFRKNLVKMTVYALLNLNPNFGHQLAGNVIFNFAKDQIANSFNITKPLLEVLLNKMNLISNKIAQQSNSLSIEVDELRYSLALKHNTTFE